MMDRGNDAMLSAAARHYDALYADDEPICSHCEEPVRDESEGTHVTYIARGHRHTGNLCFECGAGIYEEELFELGEALSIFAGIFADQQLLAAE